MTTTTETLAGSSMTVPTTDQRNRAVLSHLSGFVLFLGIPAVIGPLVAWLLQRDDPYVSHHAREALNFNLSFLIYGLVAAAAIILLIGIVLLPVVLVTWFILTIAAAVHTSSGSMYEYPLTIRFVS